MPARSGSILVALASVLCLAALLGAILGPLTTLDPDVFHEMALFRSAWQTGWIPADDFFAYTPTVSPCVNHEWGTGMILYATATTAGSAGIMLLKLVLVSAITIVCLLCARRRGAGLADLCLCSLLALCLVRVGLTTIRAQVFTLLAVAVLLVLLDSDRQGRRAWIWLWVPMCWAWLNLHAGFVLGLGVLGLHWLEQVVRRGTPQWHLVLAGVLALAVIPLNPYGLAYFPFLWRVVRNPHQQLTEWAPLWHEPDSAQLLAFAVSVLLLGYCLLTIGPRRMPGLLIVLVCAVLRCSIAGTLPSTESSGGVTSLASCRKRPWERPWPPSGSVGQG